MNKDREQPKNFNPEISDNLFIKPPKLSEMLKEFLGVSLRLNTYVLSYATLATILYTQGVGEEDIFKITCPALIGTMLAGELYFMDRLAQRFPWLETHTLSGKRKKNKLTMLFPVLDISTRRTE